MPDIRPCFDLKVSPGGYLWWYVDGISSCRRYCVCVIAFVGSVFSPYYHFSGRSEPQNHVCINVALYPAGNQRWAMTERGHQALSQDRDFFQVGPSSLRWENNGLSIDFDETSVPRPPAQWLPRRIKGYIRVEPRFINETSFKLDNDGLHHWSPIAPLADISVACDNFPGGGWKGDGYIDTNYGTVPLETTFKRWDWSRGTDQKGNAVILYDADCAVGGQTQLALQLTPDGRLEHFPVPPGQKLKRGFWGVERRIQCDPSQEAKIVRELEDSPFYTRSLIDNHLNGERLLMMHETFSGERFSQAHVKCMLPFRMPRRSRWNV